MNRPEPAAVRAGISMRPTILLYAFLFAIAFLIPSSQSASATSVGEFNTVIPLDTRVSAPEGSRTVLANLSVPEEFAGQTCTATARAENQSSVHPGNDLVVESGASQVTVEDVERGSGSVVTAEGQLVLASEILVALIMGPDESFSAGLDLHVACTGDVTTTTVASTTTTLALTTTLAPTTTLPVTTTDEVRGTVITSPPDDVGDPEELPFTGSGDGYLLLLAGAAVVVGVILLVGARREES